MVDSPPKPTQADKELNKSRIDRTQVWVAVIAALRAALAAGVPAYFSGRQTGIESGQATVPNATVTIAAPTATVTVTSIILNPATSSAEGPINSGKGTYLTDMSPVGHASFSVGTAKFLGEKYPHALVASESCGDQEINYELDRKYKSLSVYAAILDGSDPDKIVRFSIAVDGLQIQFADVTRHDMRKFEIDDLSTAVSIKLVAEAGDCGNTAPIAWINPILR
ncbi:NPCBM/NEW2 domain-containing protein [Streptosporangiaceae bacterium NEAU-GS5]|nr:NPCBM/NEW2 domain-containing protein [Streptosporangiaceae bacterium NEAU-GS5]